MKRALIPFLLAALCAAALAGAAGASPSGTKIQLRKTSIGKILVDRAGNTLYVFSSDKRNKDTCVKISMCSGTWPAVRTKAKPIAGKGVDSKRLGTITLAHGVKQVTYAGRAIYSYAFGGGPGDTTYVATPEFGGTWYAVNAKGQKINASGHVVK